MKLLSSLLIILVFSVAGYAQKNTDKPEKNLFNKEKPKLGYELFDISPKSKFSNPDGLVFADSLINLPGRVPVEMHAEDDLYAQFQMPVAKPGSGFFSEMPVAVPDSSVHYFILQKRIRTISPQPATKKR